MRLLGFLPLRLDGSEDTYALLPISGSAFSPIPRIVPANSVRRRAWLFCIVCIALLLYFGVYHSIPTHRTTIVWSSTPPNTVHPPTFDRFYDIERNYPQHDVSLPFPEGKDGRYLWVSNQHFGLGWNNIFQALYMMAQVSYLSNRAFVFEPYTWNRGPEPFDTYNGRLIPSRIPLAALIEGPLAGGPFPSDHPNPRSVNVEFFEKVCPFDRRTRLSIKELNEGLEGRPVIEVVEKYAAKLLGMTEGCAELYGDLEHPFDWMHFGDKSMSTVWPMLSTSPILREFKWSQLALSAVRKNAPSFAPELSTDPLPNVVPGLMAVHLRRGDYDVHCQSLANWSSSYMGWAQMPGLGDTFTPPPGGGWGWNTPENAEDYMRHCHPDVPHIMRRVAEVRRAWETREGKEEGEPELRKLYILTNGKRDWAKELKERILETGEWDVVFTSRDMELSFEQKYIGQAIDQAIAERAAVFVGTGFSSLTANTVLLRMIHDLPRSSNHFW